MLLSSCPNNVSFNGTAKTVACSSNLGIASHFSFIGARGDLANKNE